MDFQADLELHGRTATGIEVPAEVVEALGGGKRPSVAVTLNGFSYRTTIAPMRGVHLIPVSADVRTQAGVEAGQRLAVTVELDTAPRTVEVPDDLTAALAAAGLREAFDAMSFTRRREHVEAVTSAKKPETRERRVAKAVDAVTARVSR